ncbi:MAG: TRAP transporter TatT component family protein [Candidatus Tectimicrobiota bacterium]
MRARFTLLLVLSVLTCLALAQPPPSSVPENGHSPAGAADLLTAVDRLATESEQLAQQRRILSLLEQALSTDPGNYQLLWRATRACYKAGDATTDASKSTYFERGIALGQRAVAQQPTGVEGHFWLGANYGGLSEVQGMLKALQTVKKVRTAMQMVLQLQASYAQGDAYRALGEIERQLPGVLGGSLKRAVTYLEQGLRIAPENLAMKLALARAYHGAQREQESQHLLNEILRTPVRPEHAPADRATQEKARQLLAE